MPSSPRCGELTRLCLNVLAHGPREGCNLTRSPFRVALASFPDSYPNPAQGLITYRLSGEYFDYGSSEGFSRSQRPALSLYRSCKQPTHEIAA